MKTELINILERDERGQPELNLTPSCKSKVLISTPTQEEYRELMKITECGDCKWYNGALPTRRNAWKHHKKETCIDIMKSYFTENKYELGTCDKNCFEVEHWNWSIVPLQEFYKRQNPEITPEVLNEINKWFEEFPNGK